MKMVYQIDIHYYQKNQVCDLVLSLSLFNNFINSPDLTSIGYSSHCSLRWWILNIWKIFWTISNGLSLILAGIVGQAY